MNGLFCLFQNVNLYTDITNIACGNYGHRFLLIDFSDDKVSTLKDENEFVV